jgi:Ca2+-binding EF-hand superfamily protein
LENANFMQKDGRGRLKFADFKDFLVSLKLWQAAFRTYTKEKMGILRAERLKDALQHVGMSQHTILIP